MRKYKRKGMAMVMAVTMITSMGSFSIDANDTTTTTEVNTKEVVTTEATTEGITTTEGTTAEATTEVTSAENITTEKKATTETKKKTRELQG